MWKYLKKTDDFVARITTCASSCLTPGRILFFLILYLLCHAVISLFFNFQLFRDVGGVYAWYAAEAGRGVWWDVPLSKIPVFNVFLGGLLVRCGIDAYTSLIILSLLFLTLTFIPFYKMLKLFLPPTSAAWGCLFLAISPKLIRFAGCGLLESTRDFFLVSAVYILLKNWNRSGKYHDWILFGLALGFLSIARGEGMLMAGAVGAGLLFRQAAEWKSRQKILKTILLPIVISGISALVVMSPVLVQNYRVTGFPVTDARMIDVIRCVPGVNRCFTPKDHTLKNDPRILPHEQKENPGLAAAQLKKRLKDFPGNVVRGAYEPYFLLAVLGMILLIKSKKWRSEYSFLTGYCLILPFFFINFAVAHRYFVFFIPLLMVFLLHALVEILKAAEKFHFKNILLILFFLAGLQQPFHAWTWMTDDSDRDELELRKFIADNRQRFLPEGGTRRLIVHAKSRILFRCGEGRLFHYGENIPDAKYITGFDLMFIPIEDQKDLADCKARSDLQQIEAPFHRFVIFAPVERNR